MESKIRVTEKNGCQSQEQRDELYYEVAEGLECRGKDEKNKGRRDISEKTEPIGTDGCMNIGNGGDQTNIHLRSISGRL